MGSVMAVALGLLEVASGADIRRAYAHFVAVLPATAGAIFVRDAVARCVRSNLDRFLRANRSVFL